jgi:hypothetical protein
MSADPRQTFYLQTEHDPRSQGFPPRREERADAGVTIDFEAVLAESRRNGTCAECGVDLDHRSVPRSAFCRPKCRYAFRDRRRYAADPEAARERARAYYWANREALLERAAAKRGKIRPAELTACSECGKALEGQQRITCGSARCRDARFKRLQPESYAAREAAKVERRRERRRAAKDGAA